MGAQDLFDDGKHLFAEGKLKESIEAFTKAAEAGYEPTISYLSRGAAYLKLRETADAIADFTRVIDSDNNNPRAYYYRGMAYAQKKDFEKAVADFSRAIELKPADGASIFARGASYIELGKLEEAGEDIRNATNYLDAASQGYANMIGDRTHLDKLLAVLEGERASGELRLSDAEYESIRRLIEGEMSLKE
jgi:tetratricopeptide (TPR) repeat protein